MLRHIILLGTFNAQTYYIAGHLRHRSHPGMQWSIKGANASMECHHFTYKSSQTAAVVPFCTAITMQYNSHATRSQSVLSINSTGRVYNECSLCRAEHTGEIASSTAYPHNFPRHTPLSCNLSASRQPTVASLSTENSRSPAMAIDRVVGKLRFNSRTQLHIQVCHAVLK